jgi:hypothetical protein
LINKNWIAQIAPKVYEIYVIRIFYLLLGLVNAVFAAVRAVGFAIRIHFHIMIKKNEEQSYAGLNNRVRVVDVLRSS